jgi:C4-dicarboxylate-binding protein DctP
MTIYTPTDEEIEAWKSVSSPVYENYKKAAGDLGEKLMDEANKL